MRRAGVLLHPSSLPGPHGIGEIGPRARSFLAWLDAAGQRIWQVLPLNPVDAFGCPYAASSSFAREPLLLSMDDLVDDGWLLGSEKPYAQGSPGRVDWSTVRELRSGPLVAAADRVVAAEAAAAFADEHAWVRSWALFRALQLALGGSWRDWPEALRARDRAALAEAEAEHAAAIDRQVALQWLFAEQWARVRTEARERGIELWGDMPFFVGLDSCDVWTDRGNFDLHPDGTPRTVTGVPPDAFTPLGQLWNHPQLDLDAQRANGFRWWCDRTASALELVDTVRIDHFRGVEGVWRIEAPATDAVGGAWMPGPGRPLLQALRERFPSMPFVAEDLGVITDDVRALRDAFGLPGMVVLQFAFGDLGADPGRGHPYLPHNHVRNQVVYTGTHDNDTSLGWFLAAGDDGRDHLRRYLGIADRDVPHAILRAAWRSPCDTAIAPMQDLLGLDSSARMNVPGTTEDNWMWRMGHGALTVQLSGMLREQMLLSSRL